MTVKLPELKRALEAAGFTDVREVGRHVGTWRDSHRTPAGGATMKFAILIYTDSRLLDALPAGQFDDKMRDCLAHADELRAEGRLFDSQMLQPAATAKSVRVRGGRRTVVDGPFTETKEMLAGFNLIEARDLDDAVRIAAEFPWVETGCVEVRALQDIKTVRQRVGSA
jgi:hypothetical protein